MHVNFTSEAKKHSKHARKDVHIQDSYAIIVVIMYRCSSKTTVWLDHVIIMYSVSSFWAL